MRVKLARLLSNPLKRNIVANFAGSMWQAAMGLLFIPIYIKFMGVEAYGLIGFFATLQTLFGLLDMGLATTLTREMARLSVFPDREQEVRNLVRTLEVIYWSVALLIAAVVALAAPFIAHHWIKPGALSPALVQRALVVMGMVIALQWPSSLYMGGLTGLQRQVLLNGINIVLSTLRNAGAVLVLWLVAPTITMFLAWQGITTAIGTAVLAHALWKRISHGSGRPRFEQQLLAGVWRFAAGMSAVSLLAVLLTQVDKIVLSRVLTLKEFGYYTLATTVAASLTRLFSPVFYSLYPRFTQLASLRDMRSLTTLYHKACQFMSVLVLPVAGVMSVFSRDLLLLWTHNPQLADQTHLLVSFLIWGTALNGVMNPPYALQLAFGWTRLNVVSNTIAVVLLVPLIVVLSTRLGAVGAAMAWLALNAGYVVFTTPVMHRRVLRGEMWAWYVRDVGLPLVVVLAVAGAGRALLGAATSPVGTIIRAGAVYVTAVASVVAVSPAIREMARRHHLYPA